MYKIFAVIALFLSVVSAKPSVPFLAPAPVVAPIARFLPAPVVTAQSSQVQWRNYNGFAPVLPPVVPVAPVPLPVARVAPSLPLPVAPAAVPVPLPAVARVAPALPVPNYFFRTPVSYPSYSYPFAYRSYAW